jgi:hypothetical protein
MPEMVQWAGSELRASPSDLGLAPSDEGDEAFVALSVVPVPVAQLLEPRPSLLDVDAVDQPDECPRCERP